MKKLTFEAVLITACAIVFIACDKNEPADHQMEITSNTTSGLNYIAPRVENYTGKDFKSIDTICDAYLKYTQKIDISYLLDGEYYNKVSDGNLNIQVEPYFIVYRPEVWGQKPFVESGNPYALGLRNNEPRKLFLGKKCYVLGFELLPISYGIKPFEFTTSYKSRDIATKDSLLGSIHLSINPTAGARLLAIQSDTPFDEIDITFIDNIRLNFLVSYAIANIRYVTDKEVYDKHKNNYR